MTPMPSLENLRARLARAKARILVYSEPSRRWRDWCWPSATEKDGFEPIYRERHNVFLQNRADLIRDEQARKCFRQQDAQWCLQEDIIYRANGPVTIEPKYSLAYLPGHRIIEPVRGVHRELVPSLIRDGLQRVSGKTQYFDALIHFDGFLGKNVWHFFADAFNAMFLFDRTSIVPNDTPILIHRRIWERPLTQFVLGQPPFSNRHWIIQDEGQWVTAGVMYKAVATLAHFQATQAYIGRFVPKDPKRKIFLNRRSTFGRRLANDSEIREVLDKYGFENVYCEDLPFHEQVSLFSEVSHIVGIHGAGLANLLFSDVQTVRCLEILPREYLNPHYYWLLQILKANKYDAVVGSHFDRDLNFTIAANQLERQLVSLLD